MHVDRAIWLSGLRTAAAGGLTMIVAEALALPQGYWAVISAVIIIQNRIGASLQAAASRVAGTLAGGVVGFAVAMVTPSTPLGSLAGLVVAVGVLGMMAARYPSLRVAPVTAAILLVSAPSHVDVTISAAHRMIEILIGCGIGVLVSLTVAPVRSDTWMRTQAAEILSGLATLFGFSYSGKDDGRDADIAAVNATLDENFRSFSSLTQEIAEERASHISHGGVDPERLRHDLRGLRTSSTLVFRLARLTPPPVIADALAQPVADMRDAVRAALLGLGASLTAREAPPAGGALEQAFNAFAAAAQGVEARGVTLDASVIAYLNNLSFALEQLQHSIARLADCVSDMADTDVGATRRF
ncbi:FUSC family protein [Kaistia adipata]|uniref:FUSC family protein n=1 Tax=Kaistia adipata TaxID=166954 RepID=UPI00040F3A61|nr:FUSC family protein [Kaistia adipata]